MKPILSVCTTIYRQPRCFEAFIRSIYENASGEDFEVIVVSDRNTAEVDDGMRRLAEEYRSFYLLFPHLDRHYLDERTNLLFWRKLYGDEIADFAKKKLERYTEHKYPLWMQYAWGLNWAAQEAKGDLLLLTPGDYVVLSDLHELAHACKSYLDDQGGFFGHFSLVAPFDLNDDGTFHDRYSSAWKGSPRIGRTFRQTFDYLMQNHRRRADYPLQVYLDQTFDTYWPHNHGIRIVDRKTFDAVGGLPDFYLTKCGPTDIFNRVARNIVPGKTQGIAFPPLEALTRVRARMASVPFDDEESLEYLYPNPCDGDFVREMKYKEESHFRNLHPEWAKFWSKPK